jgi:hypothetical protein
MMGTEEEMEAPQLLSAVLFGPQKMRRGHQTLTLIEEKTRSLKAKKVLLSRYPTLRNQLVVPVLRGITIIKNTFQMNV